MYAVVRTGGKQLRVAEGDAVRVEKLAGEVGERVELPEVLLVGGQGEPRIGTPLVANAKVLGTITAHVRGRKLIIFKFKRRKNYRRKRGHRQDYTELTIDKIETKSPRAKKSAPRKDDEEAA
jgi:large subunit ribosomal protein L21